METKADKIKNLKEFLFENSCCLNCIVVNYCGSFISKEDCLGCINDGLLELLTVGGCFSAAIYKPFLSKYT